MANVVNLQQLCGATYKVVYEESYYAERGDRARTEDPWLMIVLCDNGHICPWGGDLLAACTKDNAPNTLKRLLALPFIDRAKSQLAADGAGLTVNPVTTPTCGNVVFPVEHLAEVFEIMKPRKRRQVSDAERVRLAAMSAKYGFKAISQDGHRELGSHQTTADESKDQEASAT